MKNNKKERLITRTISITCARIVGVDAKSMATRVITHNFTGRLTKEQALEAAKEASFQDFAPALVQDVNTEDLLYGMSEEDFVLFGRLLPNRKKHDEEQEEEEQEEEEEENEQSK